MTPEELTAKIADDDKNKKDILPLVNELEYVSTNEVGTYDRIMWNTTSINESGNRYLAFTENSRDKFVSKMGAPPRYFEKIRSDAREYLMAQHMEDYGKKNEKTLIRCRDLNYDSPSLGEHLVVRAFLDESYASYDNKKFVQTLINPIKEYSMNITSAVLDEDQMFIYAYMDNQAFTIAGKKYRPGLLAINSETNKHKPTVECIVECAVDRVLIRWPVSNGPILCVARKDIQEADLSLQIENVPRVILEEVDEMKASLEKAASTKTTEQNSELIASRMSRILESAKINDNGKLRQEIMTYVKTYTNYGKKACTRLDLINGVGRAAMTGARIKIARLAGAMLTKEQLWTGNEAEAFSQKQSPEEVKV